MQRSEMQLLYVDDTIEQRYVMRRILEREGYRVLEAGTGAEALSMLRPEIMLIVLDVKLPDMSGFDVCRRIKKRPEYRSVPVIQVSASFADPERRAAGLSGGADAYIAQPVHPQELLSLVSSLIRSSHADRMLSFLAQLGPRITKSLDLHKTVSAVQATIPPFFADRCILLLADGDGGLAELDRLEESLHPLAAEAVAAGQSVWADGLANGASAIAAPLRSRTGLLGALILLLEKTGRRYEQTDLVHAEDVADRVALALQNAQLFTAQRQTQEALVRSEKLAAAARLSAAIAHELNNPLASITNLIYLIETHDGAPVEVREYAKEALSELQRLSHITRQTLGFYRELTTAEVFDIAETLESTLTLYTRRFSAKDVRVELECEQGLMVHAVRGEIRQVISNLLVNAMDVLPQSGLLRIRITHTASGDILVSIRDNGPGIPRNIRHRIFEPFFTTKKGTGTGLGLWVSENIVRKHGGELTMETVEHGAERGTTFTMTLPAAPAAALQTEPRRSV